MNITATLSANSKLTKSGRIPAWNVGTDKKTMIGSCEAINCKFLTGGQFIDPETGEEHDPLTITKTRAALGRPATYHSPDGRQLIKLDMCFSIKGRPAHANLKLAKDPNKHGMIALEKAMRESPRSAKLVRGAVVGNASGTLSQTEIAALDATIRSQGFHHVLYDHGWKEHPWILQYAMASCNHMAEIEQAAQLDAHGVTVVLPPDLIAKHKGTTRHGYKMVQCPAEINGSCNECGGSKGPLCDVTRDNGDRKLGVMFTQHGPRSDARQSNLMIGDIAMAILGSRSERDKAWIVDNPDQALAAIQSDPDAGRSAKGSTKKRENWIYFLSNRSKT